LLPNIFANRIEDSFSISALWFFRGLYRTYMGGGALGSYYVLKHVKPGTDAFSPENVIVFAPSVITGAPMPGLARHSVTSVSPLSGGVVDSEAGGFWGTELKFAGLDAIVVRGQAARPVYLWVKDGRVEIHDASHLWGKFNADVLAEVEKEQGETKARILGIGPGGENLVRFACIACDIHDMHGRGGLGAVMGAKRLKAIVVKGTRQLPIKDRDKVLQLAKTFAQKFKDVPGQLGLHKFGTTATPSNQNASGQLPTENWSRATFDEADSIAAKTMEATMLVKKSGCYACPVRCKRNVSATEPYEIDLEYTGVEYESLASLGSYVGIGDLPTVCKAIELCNKYTLDTISVGGTIAFAMDCFENGLLTTKDTDGLEVTFGNKDVLIPLIERIAKREGIGDILAEGSRRAAEKIGKGAEKYLVHCKGVEYPAHEPRVKRSLALAYAVCPIGADHMSVEHDPSIGPNAPDANLQRIAPLGIYERLPWNELGDKKVRHVYYTMMAYSMFNVLDVCMFVMAPGRAMDYSELVELVSAVTGWEASLWELMKVGERRLNMMRVYNVRSGIDSTKDTLPDKMQEPLPDGPHQGNFVDLEEFNNARMLYYQLAGWDDEGRPESWKLKELSLGWLVN
jgi:aldehyde:ferredoxin oxidoreductase